MRRRPPGKNDIGPEAKEAVPALIKTLKEDWSYYHAATTLWKIGPSAKEAVPALIDLLKDKNTEIRYEAAYAIVIIDVTAAKPTIPILLQWLVDDNAPEYTSEMAAESLVKIGKPAVPLIINTLRDKNSLVRYMSVKILGEIGTDAKDAESSLVKLLKDKDHDVRVSAKEALGKIRTSK